MGTNVGLGLLAVFSVTTIFPYFPHKNPGPTVATVLGVTRKEFLGLCGQALAS